MFFDREDYSSHAENFLRPSQQEKFLVVRVHAWEAKQQRDNFQASSDCLDLLVIARCCLKRRGESVKDLAKAYPNLRIATQDGNRPCVSEWGRSRGNLVFDCWAGDTKDRREKEHQLSCTRHSPAQRLEESTSARGIGKGDFPVARTAGKPPFASKLRPYKADPSRKATMNFIQHESPQKLRGGFYTDSDIARFLTKWVCETQPASLLEPGCGDGAFLEATAHAKCDSLRKVFACETDREEAAKARARIPGPSRFSVEIHTADFLKWFLFHAREAGRFDGILGNPPFIRA